MIFLTEPEPMYMPPVARESTASSTPPCTNKYYGINQNKSRWKTNPRTDLVLEAEGGGAVVEVHLDLLALVVDQHAAQVGRRVREGRQAQASLDLFKLRICFKIFTLSTKFSPPLKTPSISCSSTAIRDLMGL